ncbi:MAG: hypothetical protein DRQ37_03085 [Gammaproteobacteria bacterium]|nr:MAG: hypothetical protein DRQ37_03085 [Gammaproteobacteria bacterium]
MEITLNPQSSGGGESIELNPKRLKIWLEGLPVLNPVESLNRILVAVRGLTDLSMGNKKRLPLLNLYRDRANAIFHAFDSTSFMTNLRSATERELVSEHILELHQQLAAGYERVARRRLKKGGTLRGSNTLRSALYGAMEQHTHALLHTFRIYGPLQANTQWKINRAYSLAEKHKLLMEPVMMGNRPARYENISLLFRRVNLLCVCDPFRFPEGEAVRVFDYLERYAAVCRIKKGLPDKNREGQFLIALDSNYPPVYPGRMECVEKTKTPRVLDVMPAVRLAVRDQLNEAVSPRHKIHAEQGHRLLEHLIPLFRAARSRNEERASATHTVHLAQGFDAIGYFLRNDRGHLREAARHRTAATAELRAAASATEVPHLLYPWTVTDESKRGYRLSAPGKAAAPKIGDLVGVLVNRGKNAPELRLSAVRWSRKTADDDIHVGVENIATDRSLPGEMTMRPRGEPPSVAGCIYLPEPVTKAPHGSIIAPAEAYRPGANGVLIPEVGREISFSTGVVLMQTARLVQFALQAVRD